jgi:hypothetical protein
MMMPRAEEKARCPHCGEKLRAFELPDNTGWSQAHQWACFNDECPYFKDGWDWMWQHYEVRASYRYRIVNQESGLAQPLAVWSKTAIRDRIIDDDGPENG